MLKELRATGASRSAPFSLFNASRWAPVFLPRTSCTPPFLPRGRGRQNGL